jgi:CRISPR-associated protein Csx17
LSDVVLLAAARNDALHSYLKAIGILRLLSNQFNGSIRAAWYNGALELHGVSRAELETFLLERYRPTPILNPWNSGAGFDGTSRHQKAGETLERLEKESLRWPEYAEAIAVARSVVNQLGETESESEDHKRSILIQLRSKYSDVALEWLDAAVLIGGTKLAFPTVLGTGGNDGRFDFSINFAQRALDVVGSRRVVSSRVLLLDALDGTAEAKLERGLFGQFRLGAGNFINPWDYVLAIEGSIAFAGAVSRRFASTSDKPSIPFQFVAIAAGYASASDAEEKRGEIWLPAWGGRARYRAVRSMLRRGRVELVDYQRSTPDGETRVASGAADAIAAAQAAQTYGVASGIKSFGRIVVAQRNGKNFGGTYVGRITVADRPEIAVLARETRAWVNRASTIEKLGANGRAALRSYNEGMIEYAASQRVDVFQDMLAALADLDEAIALTRGKHLPLQFLTPEVTKSLDGMVEAGMRPQQRLEHRIARALTSVGYFRPQHRLRYRIGRVAFSQRFDRYDLHQRFVWFPDVLDTLRELFLSSIREASKEPASDQDGFAARLRGSYEIDLRDLADTLAGVPRWHRIKTLVRAYSIVEPDRPKPRRPEPIIGTTVSSPRTRESDHSAGQPRPVVPAAFAAMKTLVHGFRAIAASNEPGNITYLDVETAYQLAAGKTRRALEGAHARLRASGADVRDFRSAAIDRQDAAAFIASLTVPIRRATAEALLRRILLETPDTFTSQDATELQEEIA